MDLIDVDLTAELVAELAPNDTWAAGLLLASGGRTVPVALTTWAGTTDVEVRLQMRPVGVLTGGDTALIREHVERVGGVWPARAVVDGGTAAVRVHGWNHRVDRTDSPIG